MNSFVVRFPFYLGNLNSSAKCKLRQDFNVGAAVQAVGGEVGIDAVADAGLSCLPEQAVAISSITKNESNCFIEAKI